jgi:hypothetical protein
MHILVTLSEKVSLGEFGHTGTHYLVRLDANVPGGQKLVQRLFA